MPGTNETQCRPSNMLFYVFGLPAVWGRMCHDI